MGVSPIRVDGGGTIVDPWMHAVGATNAAQGIFGTISVVSIEQVLMWNPDVIIVRTTEQDRQSIFHDAQWQRLKAVREGRVYVNPKGVYSWTGMMPKKPCRSSGSRRGYTPTSSSPLIS